ncbi:MAG: peptidoglycan DD-metalloendopeptidase family protein [Ekhidna sp.]
MKKTIILLAIASIGILASLFLYRSQISNSIDENIAIDIDSSELVLPMLFYGYKVDSYEISEGKVKWNQNLSEILSEFNISYQDLHILSQKSKEVYDVRKLKAGAKYAIIHASDSLKTARQFIFEPSPTEYVVYNFADSVFAQLGQRKVEVRERVLASEITSSLYNSIVDQGSSPLLVNQLVDVYAWQVDFFRIAKGDRFKIIFEEQLVDGQVIGIGDIKGAYFEHIGKEYYAIPFQSDEKMDYFDQDGNSLRKTFLKAPLNFSRISSRFSLRRFHPVQKRYKAHLGTDYAAPTGTPIRTVGDGVVVEARYHGGNGNYVKIKHNSNYTTQYLHMSKIASGIRPGVKVEQGKTIGYVGSTGLANGPHLCFRFWKNGRQVDALKVDVPSSSGVDSANMSDFKLISVDIQKRLNAIAFSNPEALVAQVPMNEPTKE